MNVVAVFALKKVHGRSRVWTFHGVLKFQFAAATRTRRVAADFDWVQSGLFVPKALHTAIPVRKTDCLAMG